MVYARNNYAQLTLSTLAALVVLLGAAVESLRRPKPVDAEPYHERIRMIADSIPRDFGPWIGRDAEIAAPVRKLLKPNVIISRTYGNRETGQVVGLMIVQCRDARDINGHFPPVCYPANGMKQTSARDIDWRVGDLHITGMEYEFQPQTIGSEKRVVENFIITGNSGQIFRDMRAVEQQQGQFTERFFGASQVIVEFYDGPRWADWQRREVFDQIITPYLPLIKAIRGGDTP